MIDPLLEHKFRSTMGSKQSAVWLATTESRIGHIGVTLTSVFSLSLQPVSCGFVLDESSYFARSVAIGDRLGLALLSVHQEDVARRFAGLSEPRYDFSSSATRRLLNGAETVEDAVGYLAGHVSELVRLSGRRLVVVEVTYAETSLQEDVLYRQHSQFVTQVQMTSASRGNSPGPGGSR
jgi:flavin reductase (DIM6/NTAB) family NADH-FMN oxidoreductase RutF